MTYADQATAWGRSRTDDEAELQRPGEPFPQHDTSGGIAPNPRSCPCKGTGAYTTVIPLADAVVSDLRLCHEHGLTPRARLLDTTTGRTGEVMEVVGVGHRRRVWLRPVGGGREWDTDLGSLRPGRQSDTGDLCKRCSGTGVEIVLGGTITCRGCGGSGRS